MEEIGRNGKKQKNWKKKYHQKFKEIGQIQSYLGHIKHEFGQIHSYLGQMQLYLNKSSDI